MLPRHPSVERGTVDICTALGLLSAAASARGPGYVRPAGGVGLVGEALGVPVPGPVRTLHRAGTLPVTVTFGALAVLDRAEREDDRGACWGDAVVRAADTAALFVDLIRDLSAWPRPAARCAGYGGTVQAGYAGRSA